MTVKYFDVIFGSSGDLTPVPDGTQVDGSVSYTQGYTVKYSTAVGSGGINIERAKMNQLFNDVTAALQQIQQMGFPQYFSALTSYNQYACVFYTDGKVYQSQINSNTSVPGADANWIAFPLGNFSGFTTGDAKLTFKTSADAGWILANDGTIGNAASGGTTRANADTLALFTLFWTNISNTNCPVSGGRGGSALADFNANKTLGIPKELGRAIAIAGSGSGLTTRALGSVFGEENHVLVTAELASHTHTATFTANSHSHALLGDNGSASGSSVSGLGNIGTGQDICASTNPGSATLTYYSANPNNSMAYVQATTGTGSVSNATNGSDAGHNTMQPSTFHNIMIKL